MLRLPFVAAHPQLILGLVTGTVGGFVARLGGLHWQGAALLGWNLGAAVFLVGVWRLYLTATEEQVRERAAHWDEPSVVIAVLVMLAMAASIGGVFVALATTKASDSQRQTTTVLAALTLVSSWFVVHSLFVAHYAHRHFQALSRRGEKAGFLFPGDPPATYLDFAYLAICVGATAQVSDPGVQSRPLRNMVTVHAVATFFYNTAVLALGVNILSGMMGH